MSLARSPGPSTHTPRPDSYPSWVDTARGNGWALNTWAAISAASPSYSLSATNNVNAVAPSDAATRGNAAAVMSAWCGGAFARRLGSAGTLLAYGGGHGDYGGNEVYGFDVSSRTWSRLSEPYPSATLPFTGLTSGWWPAHGAQVNGSPAAIHTYDTVDCHPFRNSFFIFHGQTDSGANSTTPAVGEFSLSTNVWTRRSVCPYALTLEGFSAFDSRRNKFVMHGAGSVNLVAYDVASDSWAEFSPSNNPVLQSTDSVAAFDLVNDFVAVLNPSDGSLYGLDPANLGGAAVQLTNSGKPTITGQGGFEYSHALGCFVWFSGVGANVYAIRKGYGDWRTATWTWTQLTSGGNTVTPESNESAGIYGRFRVADYDGAVIGYCVKRTGLTGTGAVYAFLLSAS